MLFMLTDTQVVPMVAVSFYVYERGKWLLSIDSS